MSARNDSNRPRRGLRLRMALYLAVLTAVLFAATAGLLIRLVEQRLELRVQNDLQTRLRTLDRLLDATGAEIESTLARLEQRIAREETESVRALLLGGSRAVPVASAWMELIGLDLFTVLDERGVTTTAGHWPERAGLSDPELSRLKNGQPAALSVAWPDGNRLVLLVAREAELGAHRMRLVGGRILDSVLASQFSEHTVWSFDLGQPGARRGGELDPVLTELGRASADVALASTDRAEYARRVLHGPDGEASGSVVVAADRASVDATLREMRQALLVAGLAVTLLGGVAGVWIAGRIDRPVRQLVRAVDAIGAGEADYSFPRATRNEFEELEQAFSRLQRSLERQRQRSLAAERVAAWRDVARHVAHEVKNPLAPIRLTVENLIRARKKNPALFEELFDEGAATILEEVEQLRQLVEEFSAFARLPRPKPSRTELSPLVEAVLDLYAAEPGLEIDRDYGPGLPACDVDSDQISRVLKNVVGNAIEAMRELEPGEPRRLGLRLHEEPDAVVIEVSDSGPGLSSEAQQGIFRPYFTTKPQGTGLGMAIAQRIVTEHGGLLAAPGAA